MFEINVIRRVLDTDNGVVYWLTALIRSIYKEKPLHLALLIDLVLKSDYLPACWNVRVESLRYYEVTSIQRTQNEATSEAMKGARIFLAFRA